MKHPEQRPTLVLPSSTVFALSAYAEGTEMAQAAIVTIVADLAGMNIPAAAFDQWRAAIKAECPEHWDTWSHYMGPIRRAHERDNCATWLRVAQEEGIKAANRAHMAGAGRRGHKAAAAAAPEVAPPVVEQAAEAAAAKKARAEAQAVAREAAAKAAVAEAALESAAQQIEAAHARGYAEGYAAALKAFGLTDETVRKIDMARARAMLAELIAAAEAAAPAAPAKRGKRAA